VQRDLHKHFLNTYTHIHTKHIDTNTQHTRTHTHNSART